ncbi:MAG: thioester reductase domain-containing protein, partial [Cyanobacteria bacterium P01_F01_bin.53]
HIHHLFDDLDVLFLGMECEGAPFTWAYGPLLPNTVPHKQAQTRRLDGSNADRAQALVEQLNPQQVYIYAMGQEPWLTYITSIDYAPDAPPILESNKLIEACRKQGRVCDRLLGKHQIDLTPKPKTTAHNTPIPVTYQPPYSSRTSETNDSAQGSILAHPPVAERSRSHNPASPPPTALSMEDTLTPFLNHLQSLDIRLWLDDDTLRCNAPKGALTPDLTAQLKENKPAIIALLKGSVTKSPEQTISPKNTQTPEATTDLADWQQDLHLPDEIRPLSPSSFPPSPLKDILLTGATGFLGAFLLHELLRQKNATIHCLVRATSPTEALAKLKQCLTNYKIWQTDFDSRIQPIVGDLSQPYLGLTKQQFYTLADQIDAIYHNGAQVHHLSPYAQLRTTNVLGTREIIKLACHGTLTPLHYTSTLSVLPPTPLPGESKIYEQADLSDYPVPAGGYNRSKWVAEQLIAQVRDRNLPTTIYRPGPISGHSETGIFNRNDFLYRLMQGYIQSGMAPNGETPLDLLPVDYAAKAIVYLSQQPETIGKAFHLIHPNHASSNLLFDACQAAGYTIQRVPYATWYQKLQNIAQGDPNHPLYPLVALFSSRQNATNEPAQTPPEIPFDTTQTYTYLKDAPFDLPPLDQTLFNTYVKAMTPSQSSPVLT